MLVTALVSSTLSTAAYDDDAQLLWLEFRSHVVYCYFDVPTVVHRGLLEANSKGWLAYLGLSPFPLLLWYGNHVG